jgi:hypothetical protein
MMASELPTVLVPMALVSLSWVGTLKRRAIIETQRFWISFASLGSINSDGEGLLTYRPKRDIPLKTMS